jgi:hypothetical protein
MTKLKYDDPLAAAMSRPDISGPANPELHISQRIVFGHSARVHPVTGMVLEQGSGALSPDEQAKNVHIPLIEKTEGTAAAAAMRAKLVAYYADQIERVQGKEAADEYRRQWGSWGQLPPTPSKPLPQQGLPQGLPEGLPK